VAVHEMGHALAALRSKNIDPVHRVSIIPRGAAALGMTMVRPLEDRYTITEPELRDRLVFSLGGRVAEEVVFGEISTGAADDLQRATEIARAMVVEFGMSPKLGPVAFGSDGFRSREGRPLFPGERPEISEETARVVDQEVSRLINEARDQARSILEKERDLLKQLSGVLIEREVIEGSELRLFVDGERSIPSKEDLQREAEEKRNGDKAAEKGNGDKAADMPTGPAILASNLSDDASSTAEIPVRPD
jgi:cell division protease FtsH